MSAPRLGDRINNYLLDELIGSGSFGQVWRAHHHVFDELVAIKIPTDPDYVQNLRREGVAIHGMRHPNIVRAIDLDPYADPPYLIMEYVRGDSLRQILHAHPKGLPV
ncbi:MAG: protein kinase, partial [Planctomycetes bacterium]|nr:protein kinase [Planctomycetota bacterium]